MIAWVLVAFTPGKGIDDIFQLGPAPFSCAFRLFVELSQSPIAVSCLRRPLVRRVLVSLSFRRHLELASLNMGQGPSTPSEPQCSADQCLNQVVANLGSDEINQFGACTASFGQAVTTTS